MWALYFKSMEVGTQISFIFNYLEQFDLCFTYTNSPKAKLFSDKFVVVLISTFFLVIYQISELKFGLYIIAVVRSSAFP